MASVDRFGEFPSAGVTEWQNTASVDRLGESSFAGITEWQNTASVDGTEWLNTPSMDGTCAGGTEWQNTPSVDGSVVFVVGPEMRVEFGVFCLTDSFSVMKHFLRIPIKNVVSLERMFGVFSFMTSICTLYLCPFYLRKHLKEPIGLISLLSKFCKQKLESSNSTSGNS